MTATREARRRRRDRELVARQRRQTPTPQELAYLAALTLELQAGFGQGPLSLLSLRKSQPSRAQTKHKPSLKEKS